MPNDNQGTENCMELCENDEVEIERMASMKCLYSTKQKHVIVAYAKQHSVAAAANNAFTLQIDLHGINPFHLVRFSASVYTVFTHGDETVP